MNARCSYEVVTTEAGVKAMLDHTVGEVMHPQVGPLAEARTLYVEASRLAERLHENSAEPLVVLDVGLGAGTNAVSALRAALGQTRARRSLHLLSVDVTLAPFDLALRTEPKAFGFDDRAEEAAKQLLAHGRYADQNVRWELALGDVLEQLEALPEASVDIVFWDLYSRRTSPRLWSLAAFSALRRVCRPGATVHTYSGATTTRSALLLAGFWVGKGATSGDKQKHTTLAALPPHVLERPLDAAWLVALRASSRGLPEDAPPDAFSRIASAPQF